MKSTLITVALTAIPALLAAQATGSAGGEVQGKINVPATYSAESKTKIEAAFSAAHAKNLPDQLLRDRAHLDLGGVDLAAAECGQLRGLLHEAGQLVDVHLPFLDPSEDLLEPGQLPGAPGEPASREGSGPRRRFQFLVTRDRS